MVKIGDIQIKFSPKGIDDWERTTGVSFIGAVGRSPTFEEVALFLVVGSGGKVKTKDEAFEVFEKVGYVNAVTAINEELINTKWLSLEEVDEDHEELKTYHNLNGLLQYV